MSINKKELISKISEQTTLSKKAVGEVIDATLETIVDTVTAGETISLTGFGKFESVARAERKGINPTTMSEITIPASRAVKFKPSKNFKDSVKS